MVKMVFQLEMILSEKYSHPDKIGSEKYPSIKDFKFTYKKFQICEI